MTQSGKDIVLYLVHATELHDASYTPINELPVVAKHVETDKPLDRLLFLAASLFAHLAGVALVATDTGYMIIGTNISVKFWQPPMKTMTNTAYEMLEMHDYVSDRILQGRRDRVHLLKVQHRVAAEFPGLREWNPPSGSPEVVLKPTHGGQRLGGCVWRPETYLTLEGRQFLGL